MKASAVACTFLAAAVWALCGCAGIEYRKVPTPTQYETWDDERQAEADAMKGVRYYLPRPFLHLKQSVPVAQRVAFFSVVYTEERQEDGSTRKGYKVEMPAQAPSWVQDALPEWLSVSQALAATLATPPDAGRPKDAGKQQAGGVGDGEQPEAGAPKAPPSTLKASTGFINASDPVTKLSELMDVVYLPDFEEQYVIRPKTGLGKAEVETRLRNGWAAEVFTQSVDNSNLIPYVIEQVEKASEAVAGIATTWGLKLATGMAPSDLGAIKGAGLAELQSGAVGENAVDFLGQTLLFKIAEVKVAQPGLYPILKPREIRQWLRYQGVVNGDPQAAFELFLQQANVPWIRPDMAFIPCPPFTMVGFNVTSDVFLTAATEKVSVQAPGGGGGSRGLDDQAEGAAKKKIAKTLFDARASSADAQVSGLLEQNITAEPDGQSTKIELKSPLRPFDPAKEESYKKWVGEALKVQVPVAEWPEMELDEDKTRAVVTIPVSMSDLVTKSGG